MAVVHFTPDQTDVEVPAGATLLSAALDAGVRHAHACGGRARCSTCRVLVVRGAEHCRASRRVTAIGNSVNVASRIESVNKELGTRQLISADSHALVAAEVTTGATSIVTLRGKSGEHRVYEVLAARSPETG